jgi:hypothetical protein
MRVRSAAIPACFCGRLLYSRVGAIQIDQHEASETLLLKSSRTPPYPSSALLISREPKPRCRGRCTSGPPCSVQTMASLRGAPGTLIVDACRVRLPDRCFDHHQQIADSVIELAEQKREAFFIQITNDGRALPRSRMPLRCREQGTLPTFGSPTAAKPRVRKSNFVVTSLSPTFAGRDATL